MLKRYYTQEQALCEELLSVSQTWWFQERALCTNKSVHSGGSQQGTSARACDRAWAGQEVDELHGWTVDLEEEEAEEEEGFIWNLKRARRWKRRSSECGAVTRRALLPSRLLFLLALLV